MINLIKTLTLVACLSIPCARAVADDSEKFAAIRAMLFDLEARDIGITAENFAHPVWGMIMETGVAGGSYSLVALADGTTSLYLSNGGGAIGAGRHAKVRSLVGRYLAGAQYFFDQAEPVDSYPQPAAGEVIFYFLGFDGVSAYRGREQILGLGEDKLSNLFYAAHEVLSEVRKFEEVEDN